MRRRSMKKTGAALVFLLVSLMLLGGVSQAGELIFALNGKGKVFVIDDDKDEFIAAIEWSGKGGTLGSLTPDLKKLYVSAAGEGQDRVAVIDAKNLKLIKEIATGSRPKHGLVSPDGKLVGVNHWGLNDGKLRLAFIDAKTDTVVKNIDLPVDNKEAKGVSSMHNAWSWNSRYFYTANYHDDKVYVIDTKQNFKIASEIAFDSHPHYFAPSHDDKELWITLEGKDPNAKPRIVVMAIPSMKITHEMGMTLEAGEVIEGHHGNFDRDGKYFYCCNRGPGSKLEGISVTIHDAKTKKEVKHLVAGGKGEGHAYMSRDGKYAVITQYGDNIITFIDTASHEKVKELKVGEKSHVGHIAFNKDSSRGYVSNTKDGAVYVIDMKTLEVIKKLDMGTDGGAGQVLNTYTNYFELAGMPGK
jgi:DNA-binding beta-propeller fold protein YncE